MTTNPRDQAFPSDENCCPGLTKREEFAKSALQGLLANSAVWQSMGEVLEEDPNILAVLTRAEVDAVADRLFASRAVRQADALIDALNQSSELAGGGHGN